jgi:hypothetical protein
MATFVRSLHPSQKGPATGFPQKVGRREEMEAVGIKFEKKEKA